jgi:hypothetical protein
MLECFKTRASSCSLLSVQDLATSSAGGGAGGNELGGVGENHTKPQNHTSTTVTHDNNFRVDDVEMFDWRIEVVEWICGQKIKFIFKNIFQIVDLITEGKLIDFCE